jgi:hypothetical protein
VEAAMAIRLKGVFAGVCLGVAYFGLSAASSWAQNEARERCDVKHNACTAQTEKALETCQESCEKMGDDVCEQCEAAFNQGMKRCDEAYVDCVGD